LQVPPNESAPHDSKSQTDVKTMPASQEEWVELYYHINAQLRSKSEEVDNKKAQLRFQSEEHDTLV
jgi:hypothetical protein